MSFERVLKGELPWKQYVEQVKLDIKQTKERRDLARKEHRLVSTPEEFDPDMIWEQRIAYPGYREVNGYTLKDIENESPSKSGFWCSDCTGWVLGEPVIKEYDDITFLSGSRGEKYDCGICGHTIADAVFEQS